MAVWPWHNLKGQKGQHQTHLYLDYNTITESAAYESELGIHNQEECFIVKLLDNIGSNNISEYIKFLVLTLLNSSINDKCSKPHFYHNFDSIMRITNLLPVYIILRLSCWFCVVAMWWQGWC